MKRIVCFLILSAYIVANNAEVCNPLDHGAKGDGVTNDTAAIQKAIDACSTPGSLHTILFQSNYSFLSFPIQIKASNTQIYLQPNATLIASPDYENWPHDESRYTHFITNKPNTDYIEITGDGVIFGNGQIWWPLFKQNKLKYSRPMLISVGSFTSLTVSGITMINSPCFHLNMFDCSNVKVFNINITVTTPGYTDAPNTDGIDVGCTNVHVYDSFIQNGDDSYVLKSGAYNVLIENSTAKLGLGLDVGTGGNISNATFRNMICDQTEWGIRLKAKADTQHGNQTNVIFRNITFKDVRKAIDINEYNQSVDYRYDDGLQWVDIYNITFEDISGTYTDYAGHLDCSGNYPCTGLVFNNIDLTPKGTSNTWQCSDNVYGTATNVKPELTCLKQQ